VIRVADAREAAHHGFPRSLEFVLTSVELLLHTYQYIGLVYDQRDQCAKIFDRTNRLISLPEHLQGTFRYSGEHHGRSCYKSDKFLLSFEDPDMAERSFIMDHWVQNQASTYGHTRYAFPQRLLLKRFRLNLVTVRLSTNVSACFSVFQSRMAVRSLRPHPMRHRIWAILTLVALGRSEGTVNTKYLHEAMSAAGGRQVHRGRS